MRVFFNTLLLLCVLSGGNAEAKIETSEKNEKKIGQVDNVCGYEDDQIKTHLNYFLDFILKLFLEVTEETNSNFIFSPYSVLLSMSALAEGSENRKQIDEALGLPGDRCVKQRYYKLILSKGKPSLDVSFLTAQALVIDKGLRLKQNWLEYIPAQFQQNIISAPIKRDPLTAAYTIRQITNFQFQSLNLTGNSVLLNSIDYRGLWQTTFPQLLLRQPFYNNDGEQIGWVDMMKTKMHVRMAYSEEIKIKVVELPVGTDGRYQMIITQYVEKVDYNKIIRGLDKNIIKTTIERLKESRIPIEVQIPRFNLNTELDMRKVLEKIGVKNLWMDPSVTRHIADVPVLPSSYIQRTNVFIDTAGVNSPLLKPLGSGKTDLLETGLDPAVGRDFIANKPMYIGLYDAELYTTLFLGSYEVPTYSL